MEPKLKEDDSKADDSGEAAELKRLWEQLDFKGDSSEFRSVEDLDTQKENQIKTLKEQEDSEIMKMRKTWACWILIFIGLIIVFDIVLIILYGFKVWDFSDSNVVIAVVTENFLKIMGLGVLITNSIFKKIY